MSNDAPEDILFSRLRIGRTETRNRIVRAGTAETMADARGSPTPQMLGLYRSLAAGSVGALITGHMYVNVRGKASFRQLGIDDDRLIPGLASLTETVHAAGAPIFAQLSHSGSQSRVPGATPLAPSPVPNPLTGRVAVEASSEDIRSIVSDFAQAARRAVESGFDGVHIHGANGYLISQFCSPVTNLRTDQWGGSAENRDRLSISIVKAVRAVVPGDFPVMFKMGVVDAVPNGVTIEESVMRARVLEGVGVDAFEVSCGLMSRPSDSARQYVAVSPRRALFDLLWPLVGLSAVPEATFRLSSRVLKQAVRAPVILTGGIRTPETMRELIATGDADLVGLSRPLIRQPELVLAIARGSVDIAACTSCNLCLQHSGMEELRCWRIPKRRLLAHAWNRTLTRLRRREENQSNRIFDPDG